MQDKIICSECKRKDSNDFIFGWDATQRTQVRITCEKCYHSGDYTASEELFLLFKKNLNLKVVKHKVSAKWSVKGNYALEA